MNLKHRTERNFSLFLLDIIFFQTFDLAPEILQIKHFKAVLWHGCLHCTKLSSSFFFTRLVSGYCDKSAKEKVEKMIDVDTKVAQKSSCSIMLSIS